MRRLPLCIPAAILLLAVLPATPGPVRTWAATPAASPSADQAPTADEGVYVGQMRAVQALLASTLPVFQEDEFGRGAVFPVIGAIQSWKVLDTYVISIAPPARIADQHATVSRMVSGLAISGNLLGEALESGDNAGITVGLIAVREAAKVLNEELATLFAELGIDLAAPLPEWVAPGSDADSGREDEPAGGPAHREFSGVGDEVIDGVRLDAGLVTITATHDGSSNFVVWLYGPGGERDLVVNEIGPYRGERAVPVRSAGSYTLAVEADGAWTIQLDQ